MHSKLAHETYPKKPIMILEFGDWVFNDTGVGSRDLFPGHLSSAGSGDTFPNGCVGSAVWK